MNKRFVYTAAATIIAAFSVYALQKKTPAVDGERDLAAVRAVVEAQQAAWNRGDIEGFMQGYAREETTTFVSGDTVTRGWGTVLERYRTRYQTRERMGRLSFTDLELKPLSPFYIIGIGRWQLTLESGETPHGRFTLLFRRTAAGWRIVHDHTSSAAG
jgi:ketosteroid isomerase-like protein